MKPVVKSTKLQNVCYDIRGPVLEEARRMEDEGHRILKLNIGNPAPFGLLAPEEIVQDVIHQLPAGSGYSDSKGLFSARKAVMQHYQAKGVKEVQIEDIYLGNGVSELIVMAMQALLNNGDEVLIPAPDYPLWTASVSLSGGHPVHYICDEQSDWYPDPADIRSKITDRTRALVIINPNNPTGAVYPKPILEELLQIAREHGLIVFADEIYDKILYDGVQHDCLASLADDLLIISFNGLSKTYRVAGYRSGWMVISGAKMKAKDYLEGLTMLASMRLCSNVPGQMAIQTAIGGYQSINELIAPDGRLNRQRELAHRMLSDIPGISCVKPKGALYLFPRLDLNLYPVTDDQALVLQILKQKQILLVQGTGFNWPAPDHLRLVFLPREEELELALTKLAEFFDQLRHGYLNP